MWCTTFNNYYYSTSSFASSECVEFLFIIYILEINMTSNLCPKINNYQAIYVLERYSKCAMYFLIFSYWSVQFQMEVNNLLQKDLIEKAFNNVETVTNKIIDSYRNEVKLCFIRYEIKTLQSVFTALKLNWLNLC